MPHTPDHIIQDQDTIDPDSFFSDPAQQQEEEQEAVDPTSFFGNGAQTTESQEDVIDPDSFFAPVQEVEQEPEEDTSLLERLGNAASYFIPKEDEPIEGEETVGTPFKTGVKSAVRALSNIPYLFSVQSETIADLWTESEAQQDAVDALDVEAAVSSGMSREQAELRVGRTSLARSGDLEGLMATGLAERHARAAINREQALMNDPEFRARQEELRGLGRAVEHIAEGQRKTADEVSSFILKHQQGINAKPSNLSEANDIWDWLEPSRLYTTFGEQAPLTGMIGATYIANPWAGAALMYGVEGGQVLDSIHRMEEQGIEIDPTAKVVLPAMVGTINAVMEKVGIDKILGGAKSVGFTRKAVGILIGALAEGGTESAQEANSGISEEIARHSEDLGFSREELLRLIPDDIGERMLEGFYGGFVVGSGLTTTSTLLGSIASTTPADAQLLRFEEDASGMPQPVFRVTKPGHELELQEVTLDEIDGMDDVQTPDFRLQRVVNQAKEAGLVENDAQAEILRRLIKARAAQQNMNTEEWIDANIESIVSGRRIEKGDLLQSINDGIDSNGVVPEVTIGAVPTQGTLAPALLDPSGRVYIGLPGSIHAAISKKYGLDLDRVESGFMNSEGKFLSRDGTAEHLSTRTPIGSREVMREVTNGDASRLLDPNQEVEINERDRVGERPTDDLTVSLFQAQQRARANRLKIWFGDSKVTNEDGSPMVLFHGTRGNFNVFDSNRGVKADDGFYGDGIYLTDDTELATIFAENSIGDGNSNIMPLYGKMENPFIITLETTARDIVEKLGIQDYVRRRVEEAQGSAVPMDVLMKHLGTLSNKDKIAPEAQTTKLTSFIQSVLISKRFSEILIDKGYDGVIAPSTTSLVPDAKEYMFLTSNQVKSAYGNRGTFDMNDPNILYQREGLRARGAVNFNSGKALIKAFESADLSTMMHELAHVFRRTLNEEELTGALEALDIEPDAGWTRENEELFADKFMQWLETGKTDNNSLKLAFRRFRNWVLEVVGSIKATDSVPLTDQQNEFFDSLFADLESEINDMPDGPKRFASLSFWFQKFYDLMDVESRFARVGLGETGFHIKNYFSIQETYTEEGVEAAEQIARLVGGDKEKEMQVILAAENNALFEQLQEEGEADVIEAATILRDYFDRSRVEYEARGAENVDFKRRLLSELDRRILKAEEAGELEKATELRNRFQEIESDFEFVSIPFNAWFQTEIERNTDSGIRLLDLLVTRYKRNTVYINDLIEAGILNAEDITVKDILQSYSTNKARDFALLNIRRAAIDEGGMVPIQKGEEFSTGFHRPPTGAIVFEGYQVRDVISDWIRNQIRKNDELGVIRRFFNVTKMAAFWNPFFLPMYDVLQSTMAGAVQFLNPIRTARLFGEAVTDVLNRTNEFYAASENGIASKPYNSPYEEIGTKFTRASLARAPSTAGRTVRGLEYMLTYGEAAFLDVVQKTFGDGIGGFFKQLGGLRPVLRNMYQTSWDTAWFLDRTVRQVTYRHFLEEGFSQREAAQQAAQAHADYASVPPKTRRGLNSIFFTPTFKIAMGKWFIDAIRSTGNIIQGNATLSQKDKAQVLMRTVGIIAGFDMLMLSLGFERDEWGRRYTRPANTETGQKELVITWTGPHNLFLKYMQRLDASFNDPSVTNPLRRAVQQNTWELHPVLRIGNAIVQNAGPGGNKIVPELASPDTKVAAYTTYAVVSAVALFAQLSEEEEFGQEGAEVFAREFGQLWEVATSPFLFKYTRQTQPVRVQNQLRMLQRIADEEIGGSQLLRDILNTEKDTEEVIEEFLDGLEERSDNYARRMQGIIDQMLEEDFALPGPPLIPTPRQESDTTLPDVVEPNDFFTD